MSRLVLIDWVSTNGIITPRTRLNKNGQVFIREIKTIDTIGPPTEDCDSPLKLVEASMNIARLNYSYGTPEDHLRVHNNVRKVGEATGRSIAVLVDLQNPKIRCGWFGKDADNEDEVQLQPD